MKKVLLVIMILVLAGCGKQSGKMSEATINSGDGTTSAVTTESSEENSELKKKDQTESEQGSGLKKDSKTESEQGSGSKKESKIKSETKTADIKTENKDSEMEAGSVANVAPLESVENSFNKEAAEVYRNILLNDFTEKDHYCVFDLNKDNVYEIAVTSEDADQNGQYRSLFLYVDRNGLGKTVDDATQNDISEKSDSTQNDTSQKNVAAEQNNVTAEVEDAENSNGVVVKSVELMTDQQVGFSIGHGDEDGKLLIRTGHDSVHHYAVIMHDGAIEISDFLVLDSVLGSVDKTKDPEKYYQYVTQDRGDFDDLIMWRISNENLTRDFTGSVTTVADYHEIIYSYMHSLDPGKTYGFYKKYIDDIFATGYQGIAAVHGEPVAKKVKCVLKKGDDNKPSFLQYVTDYLWCGNGVGLYVTEYETLFLNGAEPRKFDKEGKLGTAKEINMVEDTGKIDAVDGTLDTFFYVKQDAFTIKELQDTLNVPFYHNPLDDKYNIVFELEGHIFYLAAGDLSKDIIARDSAMKVFNVPVDISSYSLLFDENGNISGV